MSSYLQVPSIASGSGNDEKAQSSSLQTFQNVDFVTTNQISVGDMTPIDSSRDLQITNDDRDLDKFFSRPVRILSLAWDLNTSFYQIINPWSLYFSNDRVENRLTNFKLMRCKLHVRVLVNGSPFYYGRLLTSYHPRFGDDGFFYTNPASDSDFVALSQLPSFYLSPTGSHTGEMVLPLLLDSDLFDVPSASWSSMGRLILKSVGPLLCASTAAIPVSVSVFAWATDVEFGGLTSVDIANIDPQSDEHGVTPVARVATTIANTMSSFIKYPWIGKYALATQIGAEATSRIATLFGLSKPVLLDTNVVVRHTKNGLSTATCRDDAHKLTIDGKQEVTIDPTVTGAPPIDEMSILYLATRKSYLHRFNWAASRSPDYLLYSTLVDPCVVRLLNPGASDCAYAVTPLAAVTYPFKYWRGGIKYHFDVICSAMHKGRLRIVYEPTGVVGGSFGTTEFNVNTTMIIDLATTTSFEFCVPWTQSSAYRQHVNFAANETHMFSEDGDAFNPLYPDRVGNGALYVYVLNQLTCVNLSQGSQVSVVVSVSACDDYEVACPTSWDLCSIRYYAPLNPASQYGSIEPESLEGSPISNSFDNKNLPNDQKDVIYMGESIRSIRQLLKRYSMIYTIPLTEDLEQSHNLVRARLPMFPIEGGFRNGPFNPNMLFSSTGVDAYYSRAYMNYVNYFSRFYLGWRGSIRYMVDNTDLSTPSNTHISLLPNYIEPTVAYYTQPLQSGVTDGTFSTNFFNKVQLSSGLGGDAISTTSVDPTISVEIPYHSIRRFWPARKSPGPLETTPPSTFQILYSPSTKSGDNKIYYSPSDTSSIWISTGEDFSLSYFVGIPPMFFSGQPYNPT